MLARTGLEPGPLVNHATVFEKRKDVEGLKNLFIYGEISTYGNIKEHTAGFGLSLYI